MAVLSDFAALLFFVSGTPKVRLIMTTTNIVLLILLAYAAAMFLISRRANRRIRNFQDAIAAPGQTTLLLLAGSAIGGQIGSGFVIGGAEYGARYGIAGAWYGIGCGLSYFITAALSSFIHSHQYVSLADYFARRYRGHATRLIYSIAGICSCVAMLAGQLLAGRAIFLTLGLPAQWGVILTAVIALLYANAAGLWGSMAVSSIQSAIIFTGMSAALGVCLYTLGPDSLATNLPVSCFHPAPLGNEFSFSMAAPIVLAGAVNQIAFQSAASAKSVEAARSGYLLAGLALIPIAFIPPLLGMFGRTLFPNLPPESVFTTLLLTRLPAVVAAVILATVVCSVVASCNGAYIAVATNFVHDIYQGILNPRADSKTCRHLMLMADITVGIVGILLALKMNDIIKVLSLGYSLMAAGCLVPFLGGVLWRGGTSRGALFSAFTGMAASLACSLELIRLPYDSITCILLAAAVYVPVSLLTPESDWE